MNRQPTRGRQPVICQSVQALILLQCGEGLSLLIIFTAVDAFDRLLTYKQEFDLPFSHFI
jgi:hypothetical protein